MSASLHHQVIICLKSRCLWTKQTSPTRKLSTLQPSSTSTTDQYSTLRIICRWSHVSVNTTPSRPVEF